MHSKRFWVALAGAAVFVAGVPIQFLPASWQVEQGAAETRPCTIADGAVPLALANRKVVKFPGAWQLSQAAVPIGTWLGGAVLVAGAPTKVLPAA